MSAPTAGDTKKLVRLGRYFVGKPRAVALYPWQAARAVQDVFTDANGAGCKASEKHIRGCHTVGFSCSENVVEDPEHDCAKQR